jgi:cation transporter-like permease
VFYFSLLFQVLDHDPDNTPTPDKTNLWDTIAAAIIIILYAILLTIIS